MTSYEVRVNIDTRNFLSHFVHLSDKRIEHRSTSRRVQPSRGVKATAVSKDMSSASTSENDFEFERRVCGFCKRLLHMTITGIPTLPNSITFPGWRKSIQMIAMLILQTAFLNRNLCLEIEVLVQADISQINCMTVLFFIR